MTISTMPMIAGKMPPAVIPSRGASVRKAQRQVRRAVADDVEQDDRQDRQHDQQRRARRDRERAVGEEVAARAPRGQARQRRPSAAASAAVDAHVVLPSRRFMRRIAQSPTVLMPNVARNSSVPRKNSTV